MSSVFNLRRGWGRAVAVMSVAGLLGGSLPLAAFAQEKPVVPAQETQRQAEPAKSAEQGTPTQAESTGIVAKTPQTGQEIQPNPNAITRPLALSPEISKQRVGINLDQKLALTLQDAVTSALQNNLIIEQSRQDVQISQYGLFSARGIYDINLGAEAWYQSDTSPVTLAFEGGGSAGSVSNKTIAYNFNARQFFSRTGGSWRADFQNSRRATSSNQATLDSTYSPSFTFAFTQPLMRDFRIDANRRQIQVAQRLLDQSDSVFRQRVIDIINQVQRAYWDLVFAIENEKIARNSVDVARVQLENNRKMVEAGTLAPIELRSTEAALESRKEVVVSALQGISSAENVLKGLMLKDTADRAWSSWIDPVDKPQIGQLTFALDEATALALKNRPELEQMRLRAQQKEIDIKYYENQTKPQLDLFGNYGTDGVAGAATSENVPDRFVGSYFRAFRNLLSQDFRSYQVGVRLSFPWGNRSASANLGRTLAESRQLDAQQRKLIQDISIDVRNALQAVEASRQRHEAARANTLASRAQLEGEEEKFRAGLSQNYFVIERQNALAVAQGNEVRALTDYNKALAELQRVTGLTLVSNNVQVTAMANGSK